MTVFIPGGAAVTLFFILSGYVMGVGYSRRDVGGFSKQVIFAKEFYMKRMARLLPIYYIALVVSLYWPLLMFQDSQGDYWVSQMLSVLSILVCSVHSNHHTGKSAGPQVAFLPFLVQPHFPDWTHAL
jgi:peptidoglycan/LPS O-acetylase OafA/YrhL